MVSAMAFADDFADLKGRLRAAGVPVEPVLALAGVNRSTWTRWGAQRHSPRVDAWQRVKDAAERLIAEAANEAAA